MAVIIETDSTVSDHQRRDRLFQGHIFGLGPRDSVRALADFAWEMIVDAFGDQDPATAHDHLSVEDYVAVLGPLKTGFTHHPRSKSLLSAMLVDLGCDPARTYFDVPKLRVVAPPEYLTAGLGYNYSAHRDTWYAAPMCQVNWWCPIQNVAADSCMAFHPQYWQRAAQNSSEAFDAYEWNKSSRRDASKYVKEDPRPHPRLRGEDPGEEIRILGGRGSIIAFSAAQLHATVPNTSGVARFSFDFRTVHLDDLQGRRGPQNMDSASTGTTIRDFLNAVTFEPVPDEVVAAYDTTGSSDGVLVFDPSVLDNA